MTIRASGRLTAAVLLVFSGLSVARAETETTPDAAEADVADAVHLDTISITATRSPMAAFEYPGMVTVVGREQIDTTMPSTPDDILRWVPNVEFVGRAAADQRSPQHPGIFRPRRDRDHRRCPPEF